MRSTRQEAQTISEQAAQWLCVLAEGGIAEQAAFLEWLRKSPRHVEEFLFASATWAKLHADGMRQPMDVDAILAEVLTPGAAPNVVPLGRDSTRWSSSSLAQTHASQDSQLEPTRYRHMRWAAGFAALALTSALAWWALGSGPTYSTEVGEQRTVRLEDGSVLYLNTDSRAHVRFSGKVREVELLEGEALFVVAHDGDRPFRVHTDDAVVQAVGTQFNVRRLPGDTRVSVIEGRVKVAHRETALMTDAIPPTQSAGSTTPPSDVPPTMPVERESPPSVELLAAGEEATVAGNGRIVKSEAPDVALSVAWRQRRLVFKAEPLEHVVAEINRYSARHFRIDGEKARQTRLTATFDADNPQSLATFLQQYSDLTVEASGEGFVIHER
jgi:transmembrane sensor